ncbi:hypothetical protein LOK49_LG06G02145 [Camellia lanceoleosa]|uniref:Uncharacterized protein n=1 Tax=Camellia lanceoleosa TaxID=1840588 RepID=A0ACC0HEA7_9ERIC|nr:hypothetical protein LOK49_LG06G02145 [Camellia lanceoleosa]
MTFANGGGLTVRPWAAEEWQAEELKVGMAAEVRVSAAAAMEGDLSPHQSFSHSTYVLAIEFFFCWEMFRKQRKQKQKESKTTINRILDVLDIFLAVELVGQ